jgi:hypothetical protein
MLKMGAAHSFKTLVSTYDHTQCQNLEVVTLKMEGACSSETSIYTWDSTCCQSPGDYHISNIGCESIKNYTLKPVKLSISASLPAGNIFSMNPHCQTWHSIGTPQNDGSGGVVMIIILLRN